jgi:hypothetical protein
MERDLSINPRSRLPQEIVRIEDALLLCCIRGGTDRERTEQINALIRKELDWSQLLDASLQHGLVPLVYNSLKSCSDDSVPKDVLERFRDHFRKIALWSLARTRKLLVLLDLFARNGIQAIPYKGPVLSAMLYGDVCSRQYSDLDFFIRVSDLQNISELLLSEGYHTDSFLPKNRVKISTRTREQHFYKNNFMVEIHWRFAPEYYGCRIDPTELLENLQPVTVEGREVMTFSPSDLILILATHGGMDGWGQLNWLYDFVNLIKMNRDADWDLILRRAERYNIETLLLIGMRLARDLAEVELPPEVTNRLEKDLKIEKVSKLVQQNIFSNGESEKLSDFLLKINLRNPSDRVRYFFGRSFVPAFEDWMWVSLPDPLYPLYYLIRPFRLTLQYGPRLFGSSR